MTNLYRFLRRGSRPRSSGQALVELSIISVVLILLFGTVLDFGRLFYAQITVENTARAAALVAARAPSSYTGACPTGAAPTNRIGCAIAAESRGSGVTVAASETSVRCEDLAGMEIIPCPTSPVLDMRSRVTIQKEFKFMMPLLAAVLGNSLTMTASVAADQQKMPPPATVVPQPSPTPGPTPTPTPVPTPTPTPTPAGSPTPTPAPSPSPTPCASGFAPMPNLVEGATSGSTETVEEARDEWVTAGFSPSKFLPSGASIKKKTVLSQDTTPGQCYSVSGASVTVTHS